MKSRLALTLVLAGGLLAPAACQSGSSAPSGAAGGGAAAMRRDLDKICNAKKLSGADQDSSGQGTYMMAQWLDANITSEDGRAFLIAFAKLGQDKDARRKLLQVEATKVGLADCPLIDEWR